MIDNPKNCGKIMYSTLMCFHPSDFNQYGAGPSGEVLKVQLDALTKLKGKILYKRLLGSRW
jgi:hypothetical protein